MVLWDRLSQVYSDMTNDVTIPNQKKRYRVYQAMLLWTQTLMDRKALKETCICVVREVGELFPSESDDSESDSEAEGPIDMLV